MSLPSSEALTLSASIFHADVDAWLPKDFGVSKPAKAEDADWEAALRISRGDRLGLGHPDLEDSAARARSATQRAGIDVLRRNLKKKADKEDTTETSKVEARADDSDEEESRSKLGKKKRNADPFAAKKKTKTVAAVHPLLNLRNPIPGYQPKSAASAESGEPIAIASTAELAKSQPAKAPVLGTADSDDAASGDDTTKPSQDQGSDGKKSKSQLRREKRKLAKAKKAIGV